MPRAVNDSPRPPLASAPRQAPAPVVGIRLESDRNSRVGKLVVGGVAMGLAGCVLAISLFRGGVIATRVFYTPPFRVDLPLTPEDDYAAVVQLFGAPEQERWRAGARRREQYELLAYPERRLLRHPDGPDARSGALHRCHGSELASGGRRGPRTGYSPFAAAAALLIALLLIQSSP